MPSKGRPIRPIRIYHDRFYYRTGNKAHKNRTIKHKKTDGQTDRHKGATMSCSTSIDKNLLSIIRNNNLSHTQSKTLVSLASCSWCVFLVASIWRDWVIACLLRSSINFFVLFSFSSRILLQCNHNPGMCSRTTWSRPRPRPEVFEAKATKFCPRGVLEVEASPRGPHPCHNLYRYANLLS